MHISRRNRSWQVDNEGLREEVLRLREGLKQSQKAQTAQQELMTLVDALIGPRGMHECATDYSRGLLYWFNKFGRA